MRFSPARRRLVLLTLSVSWLLTAGGAVPGAQAPPAPATDRWEKDIAAFEARDREAPPPQGAIVFVGASSIRRWDIPKSFPEYTTINRGFGGTEMADAARYADRIVIPYKPRLVVVYSGDNDIARGTTSEEVAIQFEKLATRIHEKLPETRIALIGIKPSVLRWKLMDRMRKANDLMRAYCERDDRLVFIDVDHAMLGWDEKPRPELFVEDGLHLSPQGYAVWTALLRPFMGAPNAPTSQGGR
jgi:lysophospholipase L1-like esterase